MQSSSKSVRWQVRGVVGSRDYQWENDEEGEGQQVRQRPCRDEELGPVLADERDLPADRPNDGNELHSTANQCQSGWSQANPGAD